MQRKRPAEKSAALAELAGKVFGSKKFDEVKTGVGIVTTKWEIERPLIFKGSVAQPETLPHHMRRHPETGGDLFRAKAALFRELLERLELVGGMLVFQGDVLVKAEFVRVVRGVDDATDRLGLLDLPPLHPQKLRKCLPSRWSRNRTP